MYRDAEGRTPACCLTWSAEGQVGKLLRHTEGPRRGRLWFLPDATKLPGWTLKLVKEE